MKVLVVDDEKMIAQGIAHVIRQFSFPLEAVDVTFSGREALQQLQKARYQLLITDVSMPEMSGLDLIARVREQDLCPSICILSGYSEFEYARAALRYGVDDYLLKPVDKDKLFKMLERVLNKGQKAVAQRRRNTESMLSECLFEGFDLDQAALALFRGPVSVTVLSCFFQREQSILRKDLQGLYEAGLAEEIIQILHFPAFALFGKPETQSLLVKKVRADYPAMAVGYASGAVTGRTASSSSTKKPSRLPCSLTASWTASRLMAAGSRCPCPKTSCKKACGSATTSARRKSSSSSTLWPGRACPAMSKQPRPRPKTPMSARCWPW